MIESIILGTVQGIFEWLPISSQGNLVLLMVGFFDIGIKTALNYSIFLHFGTFLAVLIYFWDDVVKILKRLKKYRPRFSDEEDALISFLIISTILTGLIGYPIFKLIAWYFHVLLLSIRVPVRSDSAAYTFSPLIAMELMTTAAASTSKKACFKYFFSCLMSLLHFSSYNLSLPADNRVRNKPRQLVP